jgi:hypothetical protein
VVFVRSFGSSLHVSSRSTYLLSDMSPLYQLPPTECKHMLFNVLHGMQWHNGWIRVIDSTRQAEEARHSPATNPPQRYHKKGRATIVSHQSLNDLYLDGNKTREPQRTPSKLWRCAARQPDRHKEKRMQRARAQVQRKVPERNQQKTDS